MWEIPIYSDELSLADKIQATASIVYASAAQLCEPFPVNDRTLANFENPAAPPYGYVCPDCGIKLTQWGAEPAALNTGGNYRCEQCNKQYNWRDLNKQRAEATNKGQMDLHYLRTVLVTTGWNLNDDVFDRAETFAARLTPEDKPFNYEHNCADIIGHITSCYVSDDGGKTVAAKVVNELPSKFHIVTGAVLYKYWDKPELQDRMNKIIAEIGQGRWFVSMEALFKNFDYAVRGTDGKHKIVARNENTAFLTKHLRAYGGTGEYEGNKVGRLLRNIVFSGKGLVARPANPESIFLRSEAFNVQSASATVYNFSQGKTETEMADEVLKGQLELLQQQLKEARATVEEHAQKVAQYKDFDPNTVKTLQENLNARNAEIDGLKTAMEAMKKKIAEYESVTDGQNKKLMQSDARVKELETQIDTGKRVALAMTQLNYDEAKAQKLVTNLSALSGEAFTAHVAELVEIKKATATQTPPANPATVLGKATPEPVAPNPVTQPTTDYSAVHAEIAKFLNNEEEQ